MSKKVLAVNSLYVNYNELLDKQVLYCDTLINFHTDERAAKSQKIILKSKLFRALKLPQKNTQDAYLTLRAKRNLCKSFYRKLPRQHKLREGRWRMGSHLRDGDSQ